MLSKFWEDLSNEIERMSPTDILITLDRQRPYDGQPWTDTGERGATEIKGITFRDLRDCFIRACFDSSGLSDHEKRNIKSVYDLDWENIDIIAVSQNLSCWVEKYMGIFPNVTKLGNDVWKHIPTIELPSEES
uniref:Uncharacterized protein n=1 Tax=viral metagenome TaxID=1070528 RepID=A0A6M3J472_9ZZZZ